jgi:hypothetical protein
MPSSANRFAHFAKPRVHETTQKELSEKRPDLNYLEELRRRGVAIAGPRPRGVPNNPRADRPSGGRFLYVSSSNLTRQRAQ